MEDKVTRVDDGIFTVKTKPKLMVNEELEWELGFQAERAVAAGMRIRITVPAYQHQRSEEYLQNYDYWKPNYIYAMGADDHIRVKTEVQKVDTAFSHIKSWADSNRVVVVTLQTPMEAGDGFTIHFGGINRPYISGECTPSRCSQFAYKKDGTKLHYVVEVDKEGNGEYHRVDVFPDIEIVPEAVTKIVVTTQGSVKPGECIEVEVLAKDRFNNPVFDYDMHNLLLVLKNLATGACDYVAKMDGYYSVMVPEEGYYLLTGSCDDITVEGSAIYCHKDAMPIYWGDTHVHSNLTANIRDNDGGASPEQCYWYAKHVSKLDFLCLVEQTFRFDEDRTVNIDRETWDAMGVHAEEHHEAGRLVTFNGFELHGPRGDTVVLLGHDLDDYAYPTEDMVSIHDVWEYYRGQRFLTIPHLHRYCNGRPNLDQQDQANSGFDPEKWAKSSSREVLCEIFSSQWGRFEHQGNPMVLKALANVEGNTVTEFLDKGKLWGIVANSDGHDGNPGYGGITGVYADNLTRDGIFDAMQQRHTIGTTHTRVIMEMTMNGQGIGDAVMQSGEPRQVEAHIVSPEPIKMIEVIKNGEVWHRQNSDGHYAELSLQDHEAGHAYYYIRVTLHNGHMAWTSPIFYES